MYSKDQQRCLGLLDGGRWVEGPDFYRVRLGNFRTRMSELVKMHGSKDKPLPDGSYRFESRWRTHTNPDGSTTTAKDWRDTSGDAEIKDGIRTRHIRALEDAGVPAHPLTIDSAVEAEFASAIDPWGDE